MKYFNDEQYINQVNFCLIECNDNKHPYKLHAKKKTNSIIEILINMIKFSIEIIVKTNLRYNRNHRKCSQPSFSFQWEVFEPTSVCMQSDKSIWNLANCTWDNDRGTMGHLEYHWWVCNTKTILSILLGKNRWSNILNFFFNEKKCYKRI
jgi:hypothetical protein